MNDQAIIQVGEVMAEVAMQAAAAFMAEEGLKPTDSAMEWITSALHSRAGEVLDEALKYSKQALDAGMEYGAVAMMNASFAFAGIKAVKDVMCWSGCTCQWCTGVVN